MIGSSGPLLVHWFGCERGLLFCLKEVFFFLIRLHCWPCNLVQDKSLTVYLRLTVEIGTTTPTAPTQPPTTIHLFPCLRACAMFPLLLAAAVRNLQFTLKNHVCRNHCTSTSCFAEVIKVLLIAVSTALVDKKMTSSI